MGALAQQLRVRQTGAAGGTELDLSALYRTLAGPLAKIVRRDVAAPDPVIEDACQFAWARFVHLHGGVRGDATLAWLVATAVHEAFKLVSRERRELSLEEALDQGFDPPGGPQPHALAEQRERLASVANLPERQRRLVWLQALGLTYPEIAAHAGCTERTVERQLLRAKRAVREAEAVS